MAHSELQEETVPGVYAMKRVLAFAAMLALILVIPPRPAEAFHELPITVVDRTAVTLSYLPAPGASVWAVGVSYRFGPTWDLLLSYSSSQVSGNTAFRGGGRFHLRPPNPNFDVYATLQYASEQVAGVSETTFLLGAGVTQQLAATLKSYYNFAYDTDEQTVRFDLGLQYDLSRQIALVAGVNTGVGYVGFSYDLTAR